MIQTTIALCEHHGCHNEYLSVELHRIILVVSIIFKVNSRFVTALKCESAI